MKKGQEVAGCLGQVSTREEREDRRQQDAQVKAAKHQPETGKEREYWRLHTVLEIYCTEIPESMTMSHFHVYS